MNFNIKFIFLNAYKISFQQVIDIQKVFMEYFKDVSHNKYLNLIQFNLPPPPKLE